MKVINSRGRILLEVYRANVVTTLIGLGEGARFEANVFYSYRGPGIGGYGPIEQLARTIEMIRVDAPSAKTVGHLPVAVVAP